MRWYVDHLLLVPGSEPFVGIGFTGPTACVSPYVCIRANDYVSTCNFFVLAYVLMVPLVLHLPDYRLSYHQHQYQLDLGTGAVRRPLRSMRRLGPFN